MKFLKHIRTRYLVVATLMVGFVFVHIAQAVTAEPGTDTDPLVSQSYVDSKVAELNTAVNNLSRQVQNLQGQQGASFVIVELKPGQQLIAGASTEMILRQGQAKALGSSLGGLSDVTAGVDIGTGLDIPPNHLIIVPRDDGRGVVANPGETRNILLLVKGSYTIK